ncbi:GntR family transcriptional regulator [Rhodococcus opacus]|uniref:GntR family transcriptional regulator n=1 Tax=Rhodococcus opacus TaxID=37919 RepID=A0A2S8IZA0_RHOOP|nr:GntR family transcriptional regulator [Rhodococcus opacus]PQP20035.1 GntR family transcriptional regulator [Rhodococcus opacus]
MVEKGTLTPTPADGSPGERLSSRIARQVRELILNGEAPGGTRLRTEHLAARFGVSATPVREALMTLHGEGLVSFQPGRGFAVIPITRQDLLDLFGAQAYFAGELTARAASRMDDQQLDNLWKMQHELVSAIETGNFAEADRVEFEFHQVINHVSESPKLRWMLKSTMNYVPFQTWHDVPGWATGAPEDHLPILRALSHRSPHAARAAMTAHLTNVAEMLADLLTARGVLTENPPTRE